MRRSRRAKIIATLGPSSSDAQTIRALFDAGVDVFRLNFSHGTHADHAERVDVLREIEADTARPIGIMLDLQGPKLRVGSFPEGHVELEAGAPFRLELAACDGDERHACLPHPEIFSALEADSALLIDDGRIHLRVTEAGRDFAETEVVSGGELSDHKGVNVPGVALPISPITAKDHEDLEFGLGLGVDWVALSFVQRPDDITEARNLIGGRASILAKLEKPAAIERLEEIVNLSDAVMVARGDLGVELPPEDVPSLQKRIVQTCREAGKPVVVATQMLESMVRDPRPTRAEASDVATAVYEGADAVMLSAETAAGQHPIEAAAMMNRIVERVEADPNFRKIMDADHPEPEPTSADAITAAARQVAGTLSAAAIATFTTSGSTTLRAARERPPVPILCLTPNLATARRLALAWGIHGVHTSDVTDVDEMVANACWHAVEQGFAEPGQRHGVTAGMPFGTPGRTNLLRVAWIED